ncbi:MAG: hypothetical protein KIT18_15705 [Burkholderiales bacterium]|nr:hypothetical protein [Burkholderiales bacterium]
MRTLIFVLAGLAIVFIAMWLVPAARRALAAWVFSAAWLAVSLVNLSIGLSHGYSLREELLVHLVLFGVPVLAAWLAVWKMRRP